MPKFPIDAPVKDVVNAFLHLGFRLVREGNHISMLKENLDGSKTPLTMPNHPLIKGSTLRAILTQTGISREDFLKAYRKK